GPRSGEPRSRWTRPPAPVDRARPRSPGPRRRRRGGSWPGAGDLRLGGGRPCRGTPPGVDGLSEDTSGGGLRPGPWPSENGGMLSTLASRLSSHPRRTLLLTVLFVVVAGVIGGPLAGS